MKFSASRFLICPSTRDRHRLVIFTYRALSFFVVSSRCPRFYFGYASPPPSVADWYPVLLQRVSRKLLECLFDSCACFSHSIPVFFKRASSYIVATVSQCLSRVPIIGCERVFFFFFLLLRLILVVITAARHRPGLLYADSRETTTSAGPTAPYK